MSGQATGSTERERFAAAVRRKFGANVSDAGAREIARAYSELGLCEDCKTECVKDGDRRFWKPQVYKAENGDVYIKRVRCPFARRKGEKRD